MFAKRFVVLVAILCLPQICTARMIHVPDDYPTVHWGVSVAFAGDTVFVHSGTYYESVNLNRSIALIGEDRYTVRIIAPWQGDALVLSVNGCYVSELSLAGGRGGTFDSGIQLESDSNTIEHCRMVWGRSGSGITLRGNHNTIANNFIGQNHHYGLVGYHSSAVGNRVFDNTIGFNGLDGIAFFGGAGDCSSDNLIYHNNFVENQRLNARDECLDDWYNAGLEEGNYWSDFDEASEGAYDDDSNGIVDSPYDVYGGVNQDLYPLIAPRPGPLFVDAHGPHTSHVGKPIQFTGSVLLGTPPYSWFWDFGDSTYSTEQNPEHSYSTIELNTVVTLTVTDSVGYKGLDTTVVYVILGPNSVVYVDDDYTEETAGWGFDHYDNIQQAIDMSGDTGTIYVSNGTYYGHLAVDKPMSLIGEDNMRTIIFGQGPNAISVLSSLVTIQGFQFRETNCAINNPSAVSGLVISDNRFTDSLQNGLCIGSGCTGSIVTGNIFRYCWGNAFTMYGSTDNIISGNMFANNENGISLTASHDNIFFHNCFIDNQGYDAEDPLGTNTWDNGYPSGGNYWSGFDHSSEGAYDLYSGENQDIPGADGIADSAFGIYPGYTVDRYPHMTMPCELVDGTCGDANYDSSTDIDDVVHLINHIFIDGPPPFPPSSGDVDCSGAVDIDDAVYLIDFVFSGGPAPCDPDGDGVPDC